MGNSEIGKLSLPGPAFDALRSYQWPGTGTTPIICAGVPPRATTSAFHWRGQALSECPEARGQEHWRTSPRADECGSTFAKASAFWRHGGSPSIGRSFGRGQGRPNTAPL